MSRLFVDRPPQRLVTALAARSGIPLIECARARHDHGRSVPEAAWLGLRPRVVAHGAAGVGPPVVQGMLAAAAIGIVMVKVPDGACRTAREQAALGTRRRGIPAAAAH